MRTKASPGDEAATAHVAQKIWSAWEARCADGQAASVAGLARLAKVKHETLRVFLRPAAGATRSGPGFLTVAKVAVALEIDVSELAVEALAAGGHR